MRLRPSNWWTTPKRAVGGQAPLEVKLDPPGPSVADLPFDPGASRRLRETAGATIYTCACGCDGEVKYYGIAPRRRVFIVGHGPNPTPPDAVTGQRYER